MPTVFGEQVLEALMTMATSTMAMPPTAKTMGHPSGFAFPTAEAVGHPSIPHRLLCDGWGTTAGWAHRRAVGLEPTDRAEPTLPSVLERPSVRWRPSWTPSAMIV